MEFLAAHKIKIAIAAVAGTTCAVGLGIYVPRALSDTTQPEKKENPPIQPVVHHVPKQPPTSQPVIKPLQGDSNSAQLASLKGRKTTLQSNVSEQITIYRSVIQGAQKINELDQILSTCESIDEVNTQITQDEKDNLKTNYNTVQSDIKEYEGIESKVKGDLTQKENSANNNKESEEKMNLFKAELEKVEQQYKQLSDKQSDKHLYNSFKVISDKLKTTTSICTFKDVIKINDRYGQQHLNSHK